MEGMEKSGYFHICTDGHAINWMFKDDEDFIAGVNRIAICKIITSISVICFILMDNHIHLVLYGSLIKCKEFINNYKRLTGKWIKRKYGLNEYLKHLPTEIIPIEDEESLLSTIAYIDRNSIAAGYRFMPREYPWGTARYMFTDWSSRNDDKYTELSSMTVRAQRSLLKSRVQLPGSWKIGTNGMIAPASFIDISRLEEIFKTPARYSYFLAKKLEGSIEMSMKHSKKTFLPDKEIRSIAEKISVTTFGGKSINDLDIRLKLKVAKELRYNYLSTTKQIARILSLNPELLKDFI